VDNNKLTFLLTCLLVDNVIVLFFLFIWPFANAQFVQKVVDGF